jgi:hypothetical protein
MMVPQREALRRRMQIVGGVQLCKTPQQQTHPCALLFRQVAPLFDVLAWD